MTANGARLTWHTKIRAGAAAHAQPVLPAILGLDLAGVVDEAGPGVRGVARAMVYGLTGGVDGLPGSLAEYAAVDPALLARKPAALADAGTLRPVVDARRFTRRTVAQAHQAVEDGAAASKIVIDIAE